MKFKNFKIAILIIIIQIIAAFYIGLPLAEDAKVPSHWNLQGEIDGWVGKWQSIIMFPLINLALFALIFFFPVISPRYRKDPARFAKTLPALLNLLVFFFAAIHLYTLFIAREIISTSSLFIFILLGLLFILVGDLLPKLPSNFYLGVRVPWTLSSDIVWRKTSRLTGWCFSISGLVFIVIGFTEKITVISQIFLIGVLILIVAVPMIYAYIVFKAQNNK